MSSKSTDKETKSVAEAADVKEAEAVKADAKSEADTAVKGDKKVRKVIVVFSVGVFFICAFAIAVSILA